MTVFEQQQELEQMQEIEFTVNDHFEDFVYNWDCKINFLVGGYGSSKSYHVATKIMLKLLEEKRKCLIVREVFDTHKDSTYSLLEEVADRLGVLDVAVHFKASPLHIRFNNGSRIIFKGMDKPAKLKSINDVSVIWLEECSEVKYEGYKELLGRLRHMKVSNHIICSTNPIGEDNWTFKHFFKDYENNTLVLDDEELYKNRIVKTNNTYYHHSTCDDNFYLPKDYIEELDKMANYDKDLHRVARLGRFGINGIKVLPQFKVMEDEELQHKIGGISSKWYRYGLDFGFETSYNSLMSVVIDDVNKDLYIFDEVYMNQITDDKFAVIIEEYKDKLIKADSAEPKTIRYYAQQGFKMKKCKKFAGSRLQYTKKIKRFKNIYCSTKCKNTIRELKNLTYAKDKNGELIYDEFNIDPHSFSAIWYALDDYEVSDLKYVNRSR